MTRPDGQIASRTRDPAGTTTTTLPDGTTVTTTVRADPRWGMLLPYVAERSTSVPGVGTRTVVHRRTSTTPGLTFGTLTEKTWVNPAWSAGEPTAGCPYGLREYLQASRLETVTSVEGQTVTREMDAAGRIVEIHPFGDAPVALTWDDLGRVVSTTVGTGLRARTTSWTYRTSDAQLGTETNALSETTTFRLDDGRAARVTQKLLYDHDGVGRLDEVRGPGWTNSTTPKQILAMTYFGPLLASEELSGAVTVGTVAWTYDTKHRVSAETVNGSHTVGFGYDDDGRLVSSGALTIARDAASGRIVSVSGNIHGSFEQIRTHDAFGALESLTYERGGNPIYQLDFVRDDLGRIVQRTEMVAAALGGSGASEVTEYFYDAVGRLIDAEAGGVLLEHYEYDANGNRTRAEYDDAAVVRTGTYDTQDRIVTYGPWTHAFTAQGEQTQRSGTGGYQSLTYDAFGNAISVSKSGLVVSFDADGRGRRTRRSTNLLFGGTHHRWVWSDQLRPAAQLNASNVVTQRYVYTDGVNVPDLAVEGATTYWLIKDHLGGVRFVVNLQTGAVARSLRWDSFGRVRASTGTPTVVPFGFAGGLWEPETGLVRFGARDYDPESGRWTVKDPIRFDGGDTNLYAYVGNDPVNKWDPTGLSWFQDCFSQCTLEKERPLVECRGQCGRDYDHCIDSGGCVGNDDYCDEQYRHCSRRCGSSGSDTHDKFRECKEACCGPPTPDSGYGGE